MSSDKENNPLIDSQTMPTLNDLNITDGTGPEEIPPNFVGLTAQSACLNDLGAFAFLNQTGKIL